MSNIILDQNTSSFRQPTNGDLYHITFILPFIIFDSQTDTDAYYTDSIDNVYSCVVKNMDNDSIAYGTRVVFPNSLTIDADFYPSASTANRTQNVIGRRMLMFRVPTDVKGKFVASVYDSNDKFLAFRAYRIY